MTMKRKKLKKTLMACGVQRNDAEGFIRAYRQIQKAGLHRLCNDIMNPPMPIEVVKTDYAPKMLRAETFVPGEAVYMYGADVEELEHQAKQKIVSQMAYKLMEEGAMEFDKMDTYDGVWVRGTLCVIMHR